MFSKISESKILKWKNKKNINKLVLAVNSEEQALSDLAFNALNEIGGTNAVDDIMSVLAYKKNDIRIAAAKALGRLKDIKAVNALANALKDKDEYVATECAKSLGIIGSKDAVPALIEALKDKSANLASAAANALKKIGEDSGEMLLDIIDKTDSKSQQLNAIEVLGDLKFEKATGKLADYLKENDKELKEVATEALIKIGKNSGDAVEKLWNNNDALEYVCKVIGEVGSSKHIAKLREVIETDNKSAIAEAVCAIGKLGSSTELEKLIDLLDDQRFADIKPEKFDSKEKQKEENEKTSEKNKLNREIRKNTIIAIGGLQNEKVSALLLKALKNTHTRDAAVNAIVKSGEQNILKALEKDEWFANDAIFALKKSDKPDANQMIKVIESWKSK